MKKTLSLNHIEKLRLEIMRRTLWETVVRLPPSELKELTENFCILLESICGNLDLSPRTVMGASSFLKLGNLCMALTPWKGTSVGLWERLGFELMQTVGKAKEEAAVYWAEGKGVVAMETQFKLKWTPIQ